MEHEEYTAENYPSFGKKYNNEKAIISLTSWKARINTVSKTLFSLLKQCPGFHIVLVLSEEEFPKMMDELPDNLKLFADNELIEVLWVYKNYKSFKKVLFTMDKYRTVPVISADDDCIYTCNYAQELYDKWNSLKNKKCGIRYEFGKLVQMQGPTSLYYGFSNKARKIISSLSQKILKESEDDKFLGNFIVKEKMTIEFVHKTVKKPYKFHDEIAPMHPGEYKKLKSFAGAYL